MRLYASRMTLSIQIVHCGEDEIKRGKTSTKDEREQLGEVL